MSINDKKRKSKYFFEQMFRINCALFYAKIKKFPSKREFFVYLSLAIFWFLSFSNNIFLFIK